MACGTVRVANETGLDGALRTTRLTGDLTLSYVVVTDFNCRLAASIEYSGAAHEAPTDHPEETK
ncbi:hypothetical protein AB4Y43_22845 [Paraburkholderia sp. BR10872]